MRSDNYVIELTATGARCYVIDDSFMGLLDHKIVHVIKIPDNVSDDTVCSALSRVYLICYGTLVWSELEATIACIENTVPVPISREFLLVWSEEFVACYPKSIDLPIVPIEATTKLIVVTDVPLDCLDRDVCVWMINNVDFNSDFPDAVEWSYPYE